MKAIFDKPIVRAMSGAAFVCFIIGIIFLEQQNIWPFNNFSAKEIETRTIDFINNQILAGQATATLVSTNKESGLYHLKIEIGGNEFDAYTTLDGKYFFPEAYKMIAEKPKEQVFTKTEVPDVKLFVMSYCPFGNQAEEAIIPVQKLLGQKASIKVNYVIYENYQGGGADYCIDNGNYCSMHGIEELNQNLREICVQKYFSEKTFDFINKINQETDLTNVESKWRGIANALSIDSNKIDSCSKNEAIELLKTEKDLNSEFGVQGSPMLFINGVEFNGARSAEAYKQAICSAFVNAPEECERQLDETVSTAAGDCAN